MPATLNCFKAYDIRGKVPEELDKDLAYRIGQAFAAIFKPRSVAVGHDIRLSGPSLTTALAEGLMDAGVDVVHLGLCGTEEIYFAASHLDVDGGIIVTASHNPAEYNGMKLVRKGAVPVSGDTGLKDIEQMALSGENIPTESKGSLSTLDIKADFVTHLLSYVNCDNLKPLKLVVNPGNGCAGPIIEKLEPRLPFIFVKMQQHPDGRFPHGVPNPLLQENRDVTSKSVIEHGADLGIAWDGDFDRCFFFDETGAFIEGYYIVGLLAEAMLAKYPGSKIIHDPRLTWNTEEIVTGAGGIPVMSKTGHAFIKERMRAEDAVYGGEMSAHHYFKDFAYCDSGMIPWLLVTELISRSGETLSSLIEGRKKAFPVSGEINNRVANPDGTITAIEQEFSSECLQKDYTDGLSMICSGYRFNVRKSNTEPVLRLNVEARGNRELMEAITSKLLTIIRN